MLPEGPISVQLELLIELKMLLVPLRRTNEYVCQLVSKIGDAMRLTRVHRHIDGSSINIMASATRYSRGYGRQIQPPLVGHPTN